MAQAQLTMGPLLFHWPAERKRDFWFRIADEAPIDTAYLGEVICAKRAPFFDRDLATVAARLSRGGKRVVWSTLAEVITKVDRKMATDTGGMGEAEIEANDASVLMLLKGRRHRIGQHINVYNEIAVTHLAQNGARHFSLAPELPAATIEQLIVAARMCHATVEVQVFGRATLALSARCYHARAHGRTKDNCLFVCDKDPDGMELQTRSRQPFLAINGIQTLSYRFLELSSEIPALLDMGVSALRLSPQTLDMVSIAQAYRGLLDRKLSPEDVAMRLKELNLPQPTMNGFFHRKPGYQRIQRAA